MNLKPSAITMLAGGALLAISTFIDWRGISNALDTDFWGLFGIFVLLIGIAVAGVTAARNFGNVQLPDKILGYTIDQLMTMLALAVFLPTFGMQLGGQSVEFGLTLAWLSSAAIIVGGVLKEKGN
ncbi:MAG: hypothetical protein R2770_10465 [Acidimicrobiales bacterium]|nr:hypothetical protein [Acidimicrobiales bacterium]